MVARKVYYLVVYWDEMKVVEKAVEMVVLKAARLAVLKAEYWAV